MTHSMINKRRKSTRFPIRLFTPKFTATVSDISAQSANWLDISSCSTAQHSSSLSGRSRGPMVSIYNNADVVEPLSIGAIDWEAERNSIHCMAVCDYIETHMERVALGLKGRR